MASTVSSSGTSQTKSKLYNLTAPPSRLVSVQSQNPEFVQTKNQKKKLVKRFPSVATKSPVQTSRKSLRESRAHSFDDEEEPFEDHDRIANRIANKSPRDPRNNNYDEATHKRIVPAEIMLEQFRASSPVRFDYT